MKQHQANSTNGSAAPSNGQTTDALLWYELPSGLLAVLSQETLLQYPRLKPDQSMRHTLESLTHIDLFSKQVQNDSAAQCVLSGLWLVHGFLDQAHEICQSISTAEGSFWHAIMHRMEGDYWNAKYWYRQVGRHVVIDRIAARLSSAWTPANFVDQCEQLQTARPGSSDQTTWRLVAQIEWQELFWYCWEQADGKRPRATDAETKSLRTGNH